MNILPKFSPDWMTGFVAPQPLPPVDFKQSFASMAKTALHFGVTSHDAVASALTSTTFATDLIALNDAHSSSVLDHFLNAELAIPREHHCTELAILTADEIYSDSDGDPLIEFKVTGTPYVIDAAHSFGKLTDEQRAVVRMALDVIREATDGVVQPDFMESGNSEFFGNYFLEIGGERLVELYSELVGSGVPHAEATERVLGLYSEQDEEMLECFSEGYIIDMCEDLRVAAEHKSVMARYPKITDAGELLAKASSLFRSDALINWFAQLAFFLENHPTHARPMNELTAPDQEEGEMPPDLLMNIVRSPFAYSQVDDVTMNMMQVGEEACLRLWAKDESDLDAVLSHVSRIRSGLHLTVWLENCVMDELQYSEISSSETAEPQEIAA
jgi:hypothetical protein